MAMPALGRHGGSLAPYGAVVWTSGCPADRPVAVPEPSRRTAPASGLATSAGRGCPAKPSCRRRTAGRRCRRRAACSGCRSSAFGSGRQGLNGCTYSAGTVVELHLGLVVVAIRVLIVGAVEHPVAVRVRIDRAGLGERAPEVGLLLVVRPLRPPIQSSGVVVLDHVREAVVVGVALVVGQVAVAGEIEGLQRGVPRGQDRAAGVLRAVAVRAELTAGVHRAADVLPELELLPGEQAVAVEVAVDVGRVERVRPRLLAGVGVRLQVQVERRLVLPAVRARPSVSVSARHGSVPTLFSSPLFSESLSSSPPGLAVAAFRHCS